MDMLRMLDFTEHSEAFREEQMLAEIAIRNGFRRERLFFMRGTRVLLSISWGKSIQLVKSGLIPKR